MQWNLIKCSLKGDYCVVFATVRAFSGSDRAAYSDPVYVETEEPAGAGFQHNALGKTRAVCRPCCKHQSAAEKFAAFFTAGRRLAAGFDAGPASG